MNTLDNVRVMHVSSSEDTLRVDFTDGRSVHLPLLWYPRLYRATQAQRDNYQLIGQGYGVHWPDVDEDLSTEGLLRGAPAPRPAQVATPRTPDRLTKRRR